jgi:hypothetical protein
MAAKDFHQKPTAHRRHSLSMSSGALTQFAFLAMIRTAQIDYRRFANRAFGPAFTSAK